MYTTEIIKLALAQHSALPLVAAIHARDEHGHGLISRACLHLIACCLRRLTLTAREERSNLLDAKFLVHLFEVGLVPV